MQINRNSYELALARSEMTAMKAREEAEKNGVSPATFTRAIRGDSVRPGTVSTIAMVLGVDITDLTQTEKEG